MIRSRGKIGMDISTNRQIRKMRFSIFGGEDDVEKKANKLLGHINNVIYGRIIICEPGIRQSVSQVSLKLIRDPLRLGLTPLQHLQPGGPGVFHEGTLVYGCAHNLKLTRNYHRQRHT